MPLARPPREAVTCHLHAEIGCFSYGPNRRPALSSIDLHVESGELVVVAGPSGSGKSTLALALAGVIPQRVAGARFTGSVSFRREGGDAVDLSFLPLHQVSQYSGILFQNPEFQLIQYQVDAEVAFGPENLGLPREEIARRVDESLSMAGASDLAHLPVAGLSGGQKQRVAIAAALAMQPAILVLDEPTSNLDPVGTVEIFETLHRLSRERNLGVVVVEHKLDEIAPFADRVVLMAGGGVILDAEPARAFLPTSAWTAVGVRPPELAVLHEGVPAPIREAAVPLECGSAARLYSGVAFAEAGAGTEGVGSPPEGGPIPFGAGGDRATGRPPAMELASVTIRYKDCVALDRLSLRVAEGEWLALVGSNGSGKSTAGAALMGFTKPESGSATIWGSKVAFGKIPLQARQLGYLFQNVDEMLFCDSVRAELEFSRSSGAEIPPGALEPAEVAELIGLADSMDDHPYQLSGGERQRLALGALLTRGPRGLILDEPTTGLDEEHTVALFDLLGRLRSSLGALSCLLITHDVRLVARFADRVAVMNKGGIAAEGVPREVFAETDLLRSCGVRPPAISELHRMVTGGPVEQVAVSVEEFLARADWAGVMGGQVAVGD